MINRLKKYPKTWVKFCEYMERFNILKEIGSSIKFSPGHAAVLSAGGDLVVFETPPQFLLGCLMEFLEMNDLNISLYPENEAELVCDGVLICLGWKEVVFEDGFEYLEERGWVD